MNQLVFRLFTFSLLLPCTTRAQQDSIDAFISRQMKQQGIIGLSIGLVKNGKILVQKGYGSANVELNIPATAKTVYKIGSLSKQFVAAGVMQLAQDGRLKLDDPVRKYIKGAPNTWNSITIRHLLNHTSGLAAEPPGFDGMHDLPDSVYIKRAFDDTLIFRTGTKYEYSNFGYFVLADIIRVASGLSFPEYMEEHIFNKSGLTNTRTTSVSAIVRDRAAGYIINDKKDTLNAANFVALRPSGAFLSNVDDLLKWEMIMQHNKILTSQSWNRMWNDTIKTGFTMDGEIIYYACGWMTNRINNKQLVHHGGSLPGFKSVYFRYIEDKTAIVVLTNADSADTYAIAFGIADILEAALRKK